MPSCCSFILVAVATWIFCEVLRWLVIKLVMRTGSTIANNKLFFWSAQCNANGPYTFCLAFLRLRPSRPPLRQCTSNGTMGWTLIQILASEKPNMSLLDCERTVVKSTYCFQIKAFLTLISLAGKMSDILMRARCPILYLGLRSVGMCDVRACSSMFDS